MLLVLIITLFIFDTHLSMVASASTKTAKFGETCNKSTVCNSQGFLQCVSNVCQCVKPETMVYDETKQVCISRPGDMCKFEGLEAKKGDKFPEMGECERNSHCDETGFCVCNDEHILTNNRTCIPNRLQGEMCAVDDDGNHNCRPDKYLSCIDGTCGCEKEYAVYDEDREECTALEGVSCLGYAHCIPNAACPYHTTKSYYSSTLCVCQPGFSKSPEGLCLAIEGEACNTKDQRCGPDLLCKSGRCVCKFAERQKYDKDMDRCVSFVESPCLIKFKTEDGTKANISFPCVKNAGCHQTDNILYECRCNEGYIEGDHSCELSYDQPCGDKIEEPCDRLAPLECIDGRCKCSSEYMYFDSNSRKCKALVGSPCLLHSKDFCTGGAECKLTRNTNSKHGLCRCSQGYVTTSGRKCVHHLLIRGGV